MLDAKDGQRSTNWRATALDEQDTGHVPHQPLAPAKPMQVYDFTRNVARGSAVAITILVPDVPDS